MAQAIKKHRWDNTPRYRSWVKQRDRALEKLHTRAQYESADIVRRLLTDVLLAAKGNFQGLKHNQMGAIESFEHHLKSHFQQAAMDLYQVMARLRARTYVLAKASETEILAQLSATPVVAEIRADQIQTAMHKDSAGGGKLPQRIILYMDRMRRRIVSMAQSSALVEEDPNEFLIDIMSAFPKARQVIKPKRILKPKLMEAKKDKDKLDIAIDNIDQGTWEEMLAAYRLDHVPYWRSPEYIVDLPTKGEETWYAWEFERDMTQEFVQAVRDGQIEAARENGITDFVWIAVIDDRTDSCCLWRDGLLVSEIEKELEDHEDEDAECNLDNKGLVPPIHFNCRCTIAPATDNIPGKPDDSAKDFEDWLNS